MSGRRTETNPRGSLRASVIQFAGVQRRSRRAECPLAGYESEVPLQVSELTSSLFSCTRIFPVSQHPQSLPVPPVPLSISEGHAASSWLSPSFHFRSRDIIMSYAVAKTTQAAAGAADG